IGRARRAVQSAVASRLGWEAAVICEVVGPAGFGLVAVARDLFEGLTVPGRKESVSLEIGVDFGQQQFVGPRQGLGVKLATPNDEDLGLRSCQVQRSLQRR